MAINHHYYLKDKKAQFWDYEAVSGAYGSTKKNYFRSPAEPVWCYYRQMGGNVTIESGALTYYATKETAVFIVNRRSDFKPSTGHVITYNGRIYEIKNVDDYEGYLDDLKITAELAMYQDTTYFPGVEL